jgi:hypothetical protein
MQRTGSFSAKILSIIFYMEEGKSKALRTFTMKQPKGYGVSGRQLTRKIAGMQFSLYNWCL